MIFLFILIGMFFVAVAFYKKQRPQWTNSILFPDEKVLYTQVKTTITSIGEDAVSRGMAWAVIKITNKRIFLLYPDKKAISKVLDFSGEKQKIEDEKLQRNTLYLDRISMSMETDIRGHSHFVCKAVNQQGQVIQYKFSVHEKKEVQEILGI